MRFLCWWCEKPLAPADRYDTHDECAERVADEVDKELRDWGWR